MQSDAHSCEAKRLLCGAQAQADRAVQKELSGLTAHSMIAPFF